jgi:hypothetical protein
MYGDTETGRRMLIARRLMENGVRFVQVWAGSWDHHLNQLIHHGRQIPLQMNAERQEVWDHQNAGRAGIGQPRDRFSQARLGFQESCLHALETSRRRRRCRHRFDGCVGRWNAGAMRKDDNSSTHS